jgi:hypothetical protein
MAVLLTTGPTSVQAAVLANRVLAPWLGWGCLIGGRVRAVLALRVILELPCAVNESEAELTTAIANWQRKEKLTPLGLLDAVTWRRMQERFPGLVPARFRPQEWVVSHRGRVLGCLDKTIPYRACYLDRNDYTCRRPGQERVKGGAIIGLGFRITDAAQVRAAGFECFRWIQVVERLGHVSAGKLVRKTEHAVDKRQVQGSPATDPYYWQEDPLPRSVNHILAQTRRPVVGKRHCYELLFYDFANAPLAFAQPGRRWWANFELALVGVRSSLQPADRTRNEVLTTVTWGYDIVVEHGVPTVRLNRLARGTLSGSTAFRRAVSRQLAVISPPGHCMIGSGWEGTARCS